MAGRELAISTTKAIRLPDLKRRETAPKVRPKQCITFNFGRVMPELDRPKLHRIEEGGVTITAAVYDNTAVDMELSSIEGEAPSRVVAVIGLGEDKMEVKGARVSHLVRGGWTSSISVEPGMIGGNRKLDILLI